MGAEITLTWDEATARGVLAAVRDAYPEEACGLLLGRDEVILEAVPVVNVATDRRRGYVIAPADLTRIHGDAQRRGLEVIGVFHSHPDGAARLSASDHAAAQAGWLYVVVGTIGPEPSGITAQRL